MSKKKNKTERSGRTFYWVMLVLILLVLVFLAFSALMIVQGAREGNGNESEPVGSNESESASVGAESSASGSQNSASEVVSSRSESEKEENASSEDASSEEEGEKIPQKPFAENPIDLALQTRMDQANTMADAVSLYNELIGCWKDEIQKEVTLLAKYQSGVEEEQKKWDAEASKSIAAKEEACESMGGSAAQLELASYMYELYQKRAEALYAEIGEYDPAYQITM